MKDEKKRFTNYSVLTRTFLTRNGEKVESPYIIVEGNLTKDPELKAGENTSYVFLSLGTSLSAAEVAARAAGSFSSKKTYDENNFFNLRFFGKQAERIAKIGKKGLKVIIWGDIEEEQYKAQGKIRTSASINVQNFVCVFNNGTEEEQDEQDEQETKKEPAKKTSTKKASTKKAPAKQEPEEDYTGEDEDDEELPF